MAKFDPTWKVLPHRPLEKLADNLWRVEGDLEGMPLKRVMTLVKRVDGAFVVHNAIALEEATMAEIDALGEVAQIVVPNGYHRIDAPAYAARYPAAKFFSPPGARAKAEEAVRISGTCEDFPADDTVSYETLEGTAKQEGVLRVRSGDEVTLVFNDVIFNMPHLSGMQGFVLRHFTQSSGGPRVSRISRLFLVKDKAALKAHLTRLAEIPGLRRVIVSHHETIEVDPAGVLRGVVASI